MKDYYKLLGVLPNATTDEIKKAYRQLALKYHPDRNPEDKNSEAFFKKVTEAYSILSNPEDRENYNYEFKRNLEASESQKRQEKTTDTKDEPVTPKSILLSLQVINRKVKGIKSSRINQSALFNTLKNLLSDSNIRALLSWDDRNTNKQIIDEVIICCKALSYPYVESLSIRLARLAGSDNDIIKRVYDFNKNQKYRSYWLRYRGVAILASIVLGLFLLFNIYSESLTSFFVGTPNRLPNGDLNNTFVTENSPDATVPRLTPEQEIEKERERLLLEGWVETDIKNGQLPSCYNFVPKKSDIDNYLEVQVGGGTDVAIKLMDMKTDRCIRYVFINSGTTFSIRNIPEGVFYLKIAYGKDWYSRVENGKCVGKFLLSPMYEKGEDTFDFTLEYTADTYSIPSFQLRLDVIASNIESTFNSQNISESDFNQ